MYQITDLLLLDFERMLQSELPNFEPFGYNSPNVFGDEKGVIIIIGSDHGCLKSRFLIRTNYLDSSTRRKMNKADYGTRTLQFAEVDCKKDVHEVHAKIAPEINKAIKELENPMLVSLKYKQNILKCMLIPKKATNLRTTCNDNHVLFQYSFNEIIETKHTDLPSVEVFDPNLLQHKIIVENFKIVIAGDLSYFATCTGRDGHSHCRCPYCDATPSEWTNSFVTSNKMTLSKLHHYASIKPSKNNDTKGVIMHPLLEVEPQFYIVPILHLLIGLVNKQWTTMLHFFDEFVEQVSELELQLKEKKLELEGELSEFNNSLELLTVNKDMALIEMENSEDAREIYELSVIEIKKITEKKKNFNQQLRKLKLDLKKEQQKRINDSNGLEYLLHDILEEFHIQKQHFHGGAMNGVCCRRLLDNIDLIFVRIKELTVCRLKTHKERDIEKDKMILTNTIDTFHYLLEITDVVFSNLRILSPSEEEIKETHEAIKMLENVWIELDMCITPKAHILFKHTVQQIRFFDGIADLVEDFIERFHQTGKKLDHLVARMSSQGFRKQELTKIRRLWLSNDPDVLKQLANIQRARKRKITINNSPSLRSSKQTKARETKKVKREMIQETFGSHN